MHSGLTFKTSLYKHQYKKCTLQKKGKKGQLQHLSSVLEADASQKVSSFDNAVHVNLRRGEKIAECFLLSSCRNEVVYSVHS